MTVGSCQQTWLSVVRRSMLCALLLVAACGCATQPQADPRDPFESFNRSMFTFDEVVDRSFLRPAATLYRDLTPALLRAGVGNFLGNLDDAWSFVNSVLQLKPQAAASSFMRVGVNSTIGLGGVLDVASQMRIERHTEDFGQTLGRWGMPPGPYLVLPFYGPSTLRDAVALYVDFQGGIVANVNDVPLRNTLAVLNVLDLRTGLLSVSAALDAVALDKYTFTRDAFLQSRRNAVFDGDPPEEPTDAGAAPR